MERFTIKLVREIGMLRERNCHVKINNQYIINLHPDGKLYIRGPLGSLTVVYTGRWFEEGFTGEKRIKLEKVNEGLSSETIHLIVNEIIMVHFVSNGTLKIWHHDYSIVEPLYEGMWK